MAYATNSIMTRIEWCRRQSTQASRRREAEEWHAEEEGLRDALLNQDHSNQYRYDPQGLLVRYAIGLQDGRSLLHMGAAGWQFNVPGSTR